jgi:hypothetical protein
MGKDAEERRSLLKGQSHLKMNTGRRKEARQHLRRRKPGTALYAVFEDTQPRTQTEMDCMAS